MQHVEHRAELRAGPIPDAEEFAKYDLVVPGAANRLLTMAEKEQAHGHSMGRGNRNIRIIGLVTGFLIALGGIGLAYYMVQEQQEGVHWVIVSIAAVILAAVYGKAYLGAKLPVQ